MQLNSIANPTNPLNPASPLNPANPLHPNNQRVYQTEQQKCDKCGQAIGSNRTDNLIVACLAIVALFTIAMMTFVFVIESYKEDRNG